MSYIVRVGVAMPKSQQTSVKRRDFLKNAAIGAAALAAAPKLADGKPTRARAVAAISPEAEFGTPPEVLTADRTGSDFMVDVIKSLGIAYVCANPGSAFRGLHESVINYGGNKDPEFVTCCHEESSVAMAHGYAKIEGKPVEGGERTDGSGPCADGAGALGLAGEAGGGHRKHHRAPC